MAAQALEDSFRDIVEQKVQGLTRKLEAFLDQRFDLIEGRLGAMEASHNGGACRAEGRSERVSEEWLAQAKHLQRQGVEVKETVAALEERMTALEESSRSFCQKHTEDLRLPPVWTQDGAGSMPSDSPQVFSIHTEPDDVGVVREPLDTSCGVALELLRARVDAILSEHAERHREEFAAATDRALADLQDAALVQAKEMHALQSTLHDEQARLQDMAAQVHAGLQGLASRMSGKDRVIEMSMPLEENEQASQTLQHVQWQLCEVSRDVEQLRTQVADMQGEKSLPRVMSPTTTLASTPSATYGTTQVSDSCLTPRPPAGAADVETLKGQLAAAADRHLAQLAAAASQEQEERIRLQEQAEERMRLSWKKLTEDMHRLKGLQEQPADDQKVERTPSLSLKECLPFLRAPSLASATDSTEQGQ